MNHNFDRRQPLSGDDSRTAEHPRHRRELKQLISLYQDGEANPAEILKVEGYLQTCSGCRQLLSQYYQVADSLQSYLQSVKQPLTLTSVRQLEAQQRDTEAQPLPEIAPLARNFSSRPVARQWNKVAFGGAIAASFLVVFGLISLVVLNLPNNPPENTSVVVAQTTFSVVESPTPTVTPTLTPNITTTPALVTPGQTTPPIETVINVAPPPTAAVVTSVVTTKAGNPVATSTAVPNVPTTTAAVATSVAPLPTTIPPATPTTEAILKLPTPTPAPTTTAPVTTVAAPTATPVPPTSIPTTVVAGTPVGVRANGWIAYIGREDGEIYLVRSDGNNRVMVSSKNDEKNIQWRQLVWSNDAKWLAAVGYSSAIGKYGIYQYRVDGLPGTKPVFSYIAEGINPVWSPTSFRMTYLAGPIQASGSILTGQPAVINLKKRDIVILSREYSGLTPQWFDDEKRLFVNQSKIMTLEGNELSTLNIFENTCAAAAISPKGNKLAVLEESGGTFHPLVYDLNNNQVVRNKPLVRLSASFTGLVGHGNDCGAYQIKWTEDNSGFYFYLTQGNIPNTCWINPVRDFSQCMRNVINPVFDYYGDFYVDYNATTGGVYAAKYGDKPPNPFVMAYTRFQPVWQPQP